MELEAPLPCTEAAGRALLRMCGRWTDRYFFKNPILLLDPKQPPHEKSPVDITNWEEVRWDSMDGWTSEELKFTTTHSSEGGLDIYNDSHVHHVEEHLRIVDPVLQMLLDGYPDPVTNVIDSDFHCQNSMLPEGELGMDKKSLSSPITKQAPEVYTKRDAPGDGEDNFVQESGDFSSVTTDAGNQHGNERNVERNGMFKQSKTCSGGSGSKQDDGIDNMQQQQQQQQQQHVAAMNWMNRPGSMNYNKNSGCMTVNRMALKNEQHSLKNTQTPQHTNGAPEINFTQQKGEPELHRNRIWAITCFLSILGSSITTQDSFSTALKNAPAATAATWIVASAAPHHATGNRALLSDFTPEHSDIFLFAGDTGAMPMQVVGRGVVATETMLLPDVWYVPGLKANLVSVSQLAELDYSVAFGRSKCYIRSTTEGAVVGTAHAGEDGLFALDFLRVPHGM